MWHLQSPVEVGLEITWRCNLNCQHCLVKTNTLSSFVELSTEELKDIISELNDLGVFRIFLTGGEPLLRKDVSELIRFGYQKGVEMVLVTNGMLMAERLQQVKEYVQGIQISVDGHSPYTHDKLRGVKGSLQKAIDAAKLVASSQVPLSIHVVACKSNVLELRRIFDMSLSLGASKLTISDLQPAGGALEIYSKEALSREDWDMVVNSFSKVNSKKLCVSIEGYRFSFLYRHPVLDEHAPYELYETSCSCAKTKCFIAPNGDVLPCPLLRDLSAGNLREKSFREIWEESELINALRRRMKYGPEECRGCKYLFLCQGGCAAYAKFVSGDIMKADPRCPIIREHNAI